MRISPQSAPASVFLGTGVGLVFFLLGYLLCVGDHGAYGISIFLLMPGLSGASIALVVQRGSLLAACCVMTLIFGLVLLVATGFEGYICAMMAMPIIAASMAIGALCGYLGRQYVLDEGPHDQRNKLLLLFVLPFVMAAAHRAEQPIIS